jgi:hypothetical protein
MVCLGILKRDNPISNDDQPIRVIISFQLGSQMLWNRIFINPIIMAKKEKIIRNF